MEAMEDLLKRSDAILHAEVVLADEDRDQSTFLNVIALGSVGAGKSVVLNSLIGHLVLPTGENGVTTSPISIDLCRDNSLSSKSLPMYKQISASHLRESLLEMLSKGMSSKSRDEIRLKLHTRTASLIKLVELLGLEQASGDESVIRDYVGHNDATLLVIIPAAQALEASASKAIIVAKKYDPEGTRTVGVISKIDQAAEESNALAAVQDLLMGQGPGSTSDIPWVALISQFVSIGTTQSGSFGSENSLEYAWRIERKSLKLILPEAPQMKLGRLALVETLARQIRNRMNVRLANILSRLKESKIVQDKLENLGHDQSMVSIPEETRALAVEPIVPETDGYPPHPIDPEKHLRTLIKTVLESAKEQSLFSVDEVHKRLVDIVSEAANATHDFERYNVRLNQIVALASTALDGYKNEAKKMVVAVVEMERAAVPPRPLTHLVQRWMERKHPELELKTPSSEKSPEAEHSIFNTATSPQIESQQSGSSLKSTKDRSSQQYKGAQEGFGWKIVGSDGVVKAGLHRKLDPLSHRFN